MSGQGIDKNDGVILQGFPPVETAEAEILILGSMPSVESLRQQLYYAHPRNHFWPLMYLLFDTPLQADFDERYELLKRHKIALWDVLASCQREKSADASIIKGVPNEFRTFFETHPKLKTIMFNGSKAFQIFRKTIDPALYQDLKLIQLPSTSPANAVKLEEKLQKWRKGKEEANQQ
jgi:TDG/mug DNA glycosylase family protein